AHEVGVGEIDREHARAAGEQLTVAVVDGRVGDREAAPGAHDDAATLDGVSHPDAAQEVDVQRRGGEGAPVGQHRRHRRAGEAAGLDAVFGTEHPFPGDAWLAHGGHHALDPLVALSFAAAATTRLRLQTNLYIAAYRNPFLSAKAVATLDVLSGGRVILGVGTGHLGPEFVALGA